MSRPTLVRWTLHGLRALALGSTTLASYAWAQSPPTSPGLPKQTFTKSKSFDLPVLMEEKVRANVVEVALFVKTPSTNWIRQEQGNAQTTKFTFRAPQDGEFWFSLVTIDKNGVATPADVNNEAPSLRVVVDTAAPKLNVTPWTSPDNEFGIRCTFEDPHGDPQSLKAIAKLDQGDVLLDTHPHLPGVFRLRPSQRNCSVRVTVGDVVGNVATKDVFLPELFGVPVAGTTPMITSQQPPNSPQVLTPGVPQPMPSTVAQNPSVTPVPQAPIQPEPSRPLETAQKAPVVPTVPEPVRTPTNEAPRPPVEQTVRSIPNTPQPSGLDAELMRPLNNNPLPANPLNTKTPTSTDSNQPAANRLLVNTSRANVDYRIDQVGPSGIGKVDVYVTADQGANWQLAGTDLDRSTPAEIDLPGEGLFGIRLAITNGNGFGGSRPRPNDPPQSWIEVDTTSPLVQLRPAEFIANSSQLEIRWAARDKNLGTEPVSLFFRTRPEAPWQLLARGLKNDGAYRWSFPRELGSQFYFKVEVQDLAGNIGRAESPSALVLDVTEPRATVVNVTSTRGN